MAKRILVIDDEELITKSLLRLLSNEGYSAAVVKSGKEAIEKVKESDFDLVICDVRMPEVDGIKTIEKLRQAQKALGKKPIPEILITGYADEDKYKDALKLGVTDYIFKPFDTKQFLETIQRNLDVTEK
jgi:CheY-like chemotaxis protein